MSKPTPRSAFSSPRFAQPSTFMRLPHREDLTGVDVAIVGVPYDGGTSYRVGSRHGPREVRNQSSLIRTYSYAQKVAPFERLTVVDAGDLDVPPVGNIEQAYATIEAGADRILAVGAVPMAVGGDHSISLPLLRAVAKVHGPVGFVQFDSHVDTWPEYFGGKYYHGSPFYWAVEEGLVDPARFVQIGIRGPGYGEEDFAFHNRRGLTVVTIEEVRARGLDSTIDVMRRVLSGPTYVSFDIDAVDPAFAPGTGTPEVGGLTSHEAQRLVRALAGLPIIGCDLVEVSPAFDGPGQITALLAANLLFELLCVIAKSPGN
jgi:agmatinase